MRGNQATLMRARYEAGLVTRWHTLPHHGEATVAKHSWGVAVFILTFADFPVTVPLLTAALLHDQHERWTGDNPSPARRAIPALQQGEDEGQARVCAWTGEPHMEQVLNRQELLWLKLGDAVEAWLWTKVQYAMGNTFVREANRLLWDAVDRLIRDNEDHFVDHLGLLSAICDINLGSRLPELLTDLEDNH